MSSFTDIDVGEIATDSLDSILKGGIALGTAELQSQITKPGQAAPAPAAPLATPGVAPAAVTGQSVTAGGGWSTGAIVGVVVGAVVGVVGLGALLVSALRK